MARALVPGNSLVCALAILLLTPTDARAHTLPATAHAARSAASQVAPPATIQVPQSRSFATLQARLESLGPGSGIDLAVSLLEYGGFSDTSWALNGDQPWTAASTYKLPLLMAEAEGIATGRLHGSDLLCYQDEDYEDGFFDDYEDGACYTRDELAMRAGHYSDNTAARILVRYLGGADALNAYARLHGAIESSFFEPNTTSANDLARLWQSELFGQAGGAAAQSWLYPLLTNTRYEAGVPAGVKGPTTVVHKIGQIDAVVNDAALVVNGPRGTYVLVVMTDGAGGAAGWDLVAQVSTLVWQFEASR